jgi:hypothetical protein
MARQMLDRLLDRVRVEQPALPKHIRALDLLQMVYRGELSATPQQIRAATEALPFESPKLTAVGVGYFTNDTFAERLERALRASEKVIEGRVIEVDDE